MPLRIDYKNWDLFILKEFVNFDQQYSLFIKLLCNGVRIKIKGILNKII